MGRKSRPNLFLLPGELHELILGFLNIDTIALLRLTSQHNIKSQIYRWAKILRFEQIRPKPNSVVVSSNQLFKRLLDILVSSSATPEIISYEDKKESLPDETHDVLAQLASHLRIFHVMVLEKNRFAWLQKLDMSRLIDLKINLDEEYFYGVPAVSLYVQLLDHINTHPLVSIRSLHLDLQFHGDDLIDRLGKVSLPHLEALSFQLGDSSTYIGKLKTLFKSPDGSGLRWKLKKLKLSFRGAGNLRKIDFLQRNFGIDISTSIEDVQKELESSFGGVSLSGFCIGDCSLWAALMVVANHDIDETKLEEYYQLCYPAMVLTEAEIRERLSHLVWISRFVIGRDGYRARSYRPNHLATICRILHSKYAEIATEANKRIFYQFTPLRNDSILRDPALELLQLLYIGSCVIQSRENADKAWSEIKPILDCRQNDPNVLCQLPSKIFENFFNEPIDWCSRFDLNQPSEKDNTFLWERLPLIHIIDLMRCTSFNPRLKSHPNSADLLSLVTEAQGAKQNFWDEKVYAAIRHCMPLMDPLQAKTSWFHFETQLYADPETSSVVFDFILENWISFPPHVRFLGDISSYMKFKQYIQDKNKAAPSEELQRRISGEIWGRILFNAKTIAELQQSAMKFLDTELPLPESIIKLLIEKDASGLKTVKLDPLQIRSVLKQVFKDKITNKSQCCIN